jgi:uncharacterized membrane protein
MITFLCWYFGISIAYTALLYLFLTSDKVFCLLLEYSKNTHFNAYLNLRSDFLYLPITNIVLSVLVSPINFVLLTLLVTSQFISKGFVKVVGGQEEKYRLKEKHKIKSGGSDSK